MRYYCAPMEGITGFVFRNAHRELYGGIEKYYCPFVSPGVSLGEKGFRDLLPENNRNTCAVPQLLTNCAPDFIACAQKLADMGYQEINFNLGCPSGTVVAKKKGSGFLGFPEEIDRFFDEVFSALSLKISVKTRIGLRNADEIVRLMDIYNRYPISELIVHPRLRVHMYQGKPDMQAFEYVLSRSKNPIVYNGDLFCTRDIEDFARRFPSVEKAMLGRGLISNPALPLAKTPDRESLRAFHDRLVEGYLAIGYGGRNTMFRMKELWFYLSRIFEGYEKPLKAINKAKSFESYVSAVDFLFSSCEIKSDEE